MAERNLNIALRMRADLQQARRQLQQVEQELEDVGDQGQRAGHETGRGMERIRTGAHAVGIALAGIGVAATVFTVISQRSANAAVELERMARISNATVEGFQRIAFAAGEYNVEQGQVADILRDLQDRIGDFLQTGAGEFADFFENIAPQVGLTADELARMSGPQALQAVYNALDQAGLSTSEMTFYLEALASEGSSLIPILRNNGAEISRLGDEADRTGTILSQLEVERLSKMRSEFRQLEQQLSTETSRAVSQFDELMTSSLDGISVGIRVVSREFGAFMDRFRAPEAMRSIEGIDAAIERVEERIQSLRDQRDTSQPSAPGLGGSMGFPAPSVEAANQEIEELEKVLGPLKRRRFEARFSGLRPGDPGFNEQEGVAPTQPDPEADIGGSGGIGGGDSSGPSDAARANEAALDSLMSLESGMQQQIATFGEGEAAALEYRLTVGDLADDVARLGAEGEALAAGIVEQAREIERLTEAEEHRAEAEQQRKQAQQQAEQNLQRFLDQADPTRGLERQLALIEELKQQFPQYAAALEEASAQVSGRIDEINQGLLNATSINAEFAYAGTDALGSFAEDIANGRDAVGSLGDSFRQFAADFLSYIAQMIMQQAIFNALQNSSGGGIGGIISGALGAVTGGGGGGAAGGLYANVATYHGGGVIGGGMPGAYRGLAPDEVPAVFRRGEEVLTEGDPRHRNNLGDQEIQRERGLTIINTFNADEAFQAGISTPKGTKALFNTMRQNRSHVRKILGF